MTFSQVRVVFTVRFRWAVKKPSHPGDLKNLKELMVHLICSLCYQVLLYVWLLNSLGVLRKVGVQQQFQGFLVVQISTSVWLIGTLLRFGSD